MKAAILRKYAKNNLALHIEEVDMSKINANQVLIRVSASGVNPLDNMITRGEVKLIAPYKLPLITGNELVGYIEEIGKEVKTLKKGDRVFSRLPLSNIGAFAEYVAVDESAVALVPDYLTDEQAASIPLAALTVMQAFDVMRVEQGKTLFISGGTGSLGAIAIPIAKAKGLKVITNGNAANQSRVIQLGVDQFIDYKTEDYVSCLSNIDYVLDTLGGKETEKQFSILKKGGKLVSLKGMPNAAFAKRMHLPLWKQGLFYFAGRKLDKLAMKHQSEYHFVFVESNGKQLQEVAKICERHKIIPSVDTIFPFDELNYALDKVENGQSTGKTIITF
ncbi:MULTISPECIES: NADP-dependent oxidoreductase [unclassified Granulicatella]|uniref:NADP-dependent oxidoreductase n=1 Tax=unclassified Granulicatella TaxID=2630493 RepID=UPI0010736931|nr:MULTISPECIES: NADP-dependent oxidoreductase [unclassified Granulicatella]MBF0780633.1 NADP-dependent oxidoreductase [Granulicatella sp. 19428wC4_WM01]TFU94591.1 NADP-dependent oxidoreductase [Granulicatella sp. WM01]